MWQFYTSFHGRVSRRDYLLKLVLPGIGLFIAALIVQRLLTPPDKLVFGPGPLPLVLTLLTIWPGFAVKAKRLHDRGHSGWWTLMETPMYFLGGFVALFAIAAGMSGAPGGGWTWTGVMAIGGLAAFASTIAGLWIFVQTYLLPGDHGDNRFGPDPLQPAPVTLPGRTPAPPSPAPAASPSLRAQPGFGRRQPGAR